MLQNFHSLGIRKKIIAGTPRPQPRRNKINWAGTEMKIFPSFARRKRENRKMGHTQEENRRKTPVLSDRELTLKNPQNPVLTHGRFLKVQTSKHFTRRRKRENKRGDADVTIREHSASIRMAGETPVGIPWIQKNWDSHSPMMERQNIVDTGD